ncbi:acetyltransferase [Vibrio cholerae]|nr:acetyltransferase [Vibrio cholerae]
MVSAVVCEYSVMRCQPLRRALCVFLESFHSSALIIQT